MTVDLRLGLRSDDPGPPTIAGPRSYPTGVAARLAVAAKDIIGRYPRARSALLPLLYLVQAEDGYITRAGVEFCSDQLGMAAAEVVAVATFYSMYRRRPTGQYLVGVCTNALCAIMGGDHILAVLQRHLGIAAGQTTDDGVVTLEHVECNAACDYAPVVMVNWEFFDNQNSASACALVDALRRGELVSPTRGAPLRSYSMTARVLAGIPDERRDARHADRGDTHAATLAGLQAARDNSMRAPSVTDARNNSAATGNG